MLEEEHKEGRRWKKTTHSGTDARAGIPRQPSPKRIGRRGSRAQPVRSVSPRQRSRTELTHSPNWHMAKSHGRRKSTCVGRQLQRKKGKKKKEGSRGSVSSCFLEQQIRREEKQHQEHDPELCYNNKASQLFQGALDCSLAKGTAQAIQKTKTA